MLFDHFITIAEQDVDRVLNTVWVNATSTLSVMLEEYRAKQGSQQKFEIMRDYLDGVLALAKSVGYLGQDTAITIRDMRDQCDDILQNWE